MTRTLRKRLPWCFAVLLAILVHFLMAPSAPNLPILPLEREPMGRTAY